MDVGGRTNSRNGDGLCQAFYGTQDATYELNKAAASLAKQVGARYDMLYPS